MALPPTFKMQVAGGKTADIPTPGFGTWAFEGTPIDPAKPEWIKNALKTALDAGYRHLECAWFYGVSVIEEWSRTPTSSKAAYSYQVDKEIGEAIREYGIPRSELFISSKIWCNFFHPDMVEVCCDKILQDMGVDYLDCLLLHWPCAMAPISHDALRNADAGNQASLEKKGMLIKDGNLVIDWQHTSEPIARAGGHPEGSIVPTWNALKEIARKGKARAIGVSNFDIADLKVLLPHAQDVPISVNQVEVHPWHPQRDLLDYCNQNSIIVSCFSPFAGQKADGKTLIHDPTVQKLAKKNDMGVGQLLQSWAVQRGTVPLGKSGNEGEQLA